jgi:hypothetical protein
LIPEQLKCDGGKPCTRCRTANLYCDFIKPVSDPVTEYLPFLLPLLPTSLTYTLLRKLAEIEAQMDMLRNRIPDTTTAVALLESQHQHAQNGNGNETGSPGYSQQYQRQGQQREFASPVSNLSISMSGNNQHSQPQNDIPYSRGYSESSSTSYGNGAGWLKKKRGDFELNVEVMLDVVSKGLISHEDASVYFRTFFQGCVSFTLLKLR